MNYKELISSIKNKETQPVYFLLGDEPYYIDRITNAFTDIILEEEKDFNQIILYGKDTNIEEIILEAKQFPFGSEKRVIIVKDAQDLKKIELIEDYLYNPQKSTILIFSYRNKTIDKRKKIGKIIYKNSVVFESKKLYENAIPIWINNYVKEKGYKIDNNATAMITEFLGSNLTKITNELNKLMLVIDNKNIIEAKTIEHYIGISKDYNIFELQNSLAERNSVKVNQIINHFEKNPKNYNIIPIISSLFNFFQKVLFLYELKNKDQKTISNVLKINPFFINQYKIAYNNFSRVKIYRILEFLDSYDQRSKGVKNNKTPHSELLKELTLKILYI